MPPGIINHVKNQYIILIMPPAMIEKRAKNTKKVKTAHKQAAVDFLCDYSTSKELDVQRFYEL